MNLCYPNNSVSIHEDILLKYFNIIMGVTDDAKKMIVNHSLFTYSMKAAKESKFAVSANQDYGIDDKTKSRRELIDQCSKIFDKAQKAIEAEIAKGKALLDKLQNYFGYTAEDDLLPDKSDINKLLNDIKDFYEDAFKIGCNINSQKDTAVALGKMAEEIEKSVAVLATDFNNKSPVEKILLFSDDPIGKLLQFAKLLDDVDKDVGSACDYIKSEEQKLIKKGAWNENKDPRFAEEKYDFEVLYSKITEVK